MKITEITAENLADLTREDALAAIAEGEVELDRLLESDAAEDVAAGTALNELIDSITARVAEIDVAEQAQVDEVQRLRDAKAARAATAEAAAAEPEAEVEPEQPETDEVVEPEVEPSIPEVTAEVPEVVEVVETEDNAPTAVAASVRGRLAGRRPAPPQKETPVDKSHLPVLVASAGNGLVDANTPVGFGEFREIAQSQLQGAKGSKIRTKQRVGSFAMQTPADLEIGPLSTQEQMNAAVERAVDIDRIREAKGSLVAAAGKELGVANDTAALTAAGWCAPSETVYDLCDNGSREGLFELPEITINRGGINFTQGLDSSALYAPEFGWDITEAEMDADDFEKNCVSVPCPDFDEVRLNAVGFCVTSDLLPKAAYPELEQWFLREALIAFDHKKARKQFNAALATAGTAIVAPDMGSVASSTLTAVELVVEGERQKYGWSDNQPVEAVVPQYAKAAFRADLANRTGLLELAVTDAQIAGWFAARNIRIQYIRHYTGFILPEGTATMPATMQVLVFKAGTYVTGAAPVINLSTVYDSTLLAQNKAMAVFYEQGLLLLKRCYGSRRITIPICAVGRTGAADVTCEVETP